MQLFGFSTEDERGLFRMFLGVSKIGPKLALSVLSGIAVEELCAAIAAGNVARLATVPGIGLKTAERVVLELRGKVGATAALPDVPAATASGAGRGLAANDAVAALVNLGYRSKDAEKAVGRAAREGDGSLEGLIRQALTILSA